MDNFFLNRNLFRLFRIKFPILDPRLTLISYIKLRNKYFNKLFLYFKSFSRKPLSQRILGILLRLLNFLIQFVMVQGFGEKKSKKITPIRKLKFEFSRIIYSSHNQIVTFTLETRFNAILIFFLHNYFFQINFHQK